MPQIIIEHDIPLDKAIKVKLIEVLEELCARLFSVDNWSLEPREFGFKFDRITPPDRSTNSVVVRMTLHDFGDWFRVKRSDAHAALIRNAVLDVLDVSSTTPSVGVALTYAHVAWSSVTINDAP